MAGSALERVVVKIFSLFGAFAKMVFSDGIWDFSLTRRRIELILFPLDFYFSPNRF